MRDDSNLIIEGLSDESVDITINYIDKFIHEYDTKDKKLSDEEWLKNHLKQELPETTDEEIKNTTSEIILSIKGYDNELKDINKKQSQGISSEKWAANKIIEASSVGEINKFGNYLSSVDKAISDANAQMYRTMTTNTGDISQCMNLDGFIAEQYAVNSFNAKAALNNSSMQAEVMGPGPGQTYGKNSFDLIVKNKNTGKIIHQYQAKFGKDAQSTIKYLKKGNYNNQRILVPEEQVEEVQKAFPGKTVSSTIGGTDQVKIKSEPLSKENAKNMQSDAQKNGNVYKENWNIFNIKELAYNIGKQSVNRAIETAILSAAFEIINKKIQHQEIHVDELLKLALKSGTDVGIKSAVAGALTVLVKKGLLKIIPPNTPVEVIANIACVGVEITKILIKKAKGEITTVETVDQVARTTQVMTLSLICSKMGMSIGASALSFIPVFGSLIGGMIGSIIGYKLGQSVGEEVYKAQKTVAKATFKYAKGTLDSIKYSTSRVAYGITN